MRAIDVLNAAKRTFDGYGDESYAKSKSNAFLRRCGATIEMGPDQEIGMDSVKRVCFAMLDAHSEELFWSHLRRSD